LENRGSIFVVWPCRKTYIGTSVWRPAVVAFRLHIVECVAAPVVIKGHGATLPIPTLDGNFATSLYALHVPPSHCRLVFRRCPVPVRARYLRVNLLRCLRARPVQAVPATAHPLPQVTLLATVLLTRVVILQVTARPIPLVITHRTRPVILPVTAPQIRPVTHLATVLRAPLVILRLIVHQILAVSTPIFQAVVRFLHKKIIGEPLQKPLLARLVNIGTLNPLMPIPGQLRIIPVAV
jgi:hypothetical protein